MDPSGANGGPSTPFTKPVDRGEKDIRNDESVPQDNFHAETPPDMNAATMDYSKKFPT